MVAQLLLVGYVLVSIFESDTPWVVLAVIAVTVSYTHLTLPTIYSV